MYAYHLLVNTAVGEYEGILGTVPGTDDVALMCTYVCLYSCAYMVVCLIYVYVRVCV